MSVSARPPMGPHDLNLTVAKIITGPPGNQKRGTGTLVTPELILTALHVVADRFQEPPVFAPEGTIEVRFLKTGFTTRATVVEDCYDADEDWVLLRCESPPPKLLPAPLGTLRANEAGADVNVRIYGFPSTSPVFGFTYSGYVADARSRYAGQPDGPRTPEPAEAIECHIDGQGQALSGLSGGPCFVGGALVGVIRATLNNKDKLSLGVVYACPVQAVLAKAQDRLPVIDPYRGLPGLPLRDLPRRPFRYLDPYTEKDAEIFFGRGHPLVEIYRTILSPDSPPILLFFGQTGAGKSSLLDAGLCPRLRLHHKPIYVRRDLALGLVGSLENALREALGPDAVASTPQGLWLQAENALGRPVIVILDQIEEAYSRPRLPAEGSPEGMPGDIEMTELAVFVAALLSDWTTRPQGRLILSFRKEWLPEISKKMGSHGVSYSQYFLERLSNEEVEEVVLGLERTERIRKKWMARVDPELPMLVRHQLASDAKSPLAPTLQILMTRLFEAAEALHPSAPELTVALLRTQSEKGLLFKDFLPQQIAIVATRHEPLVRSGLVDDLLDFHTTEVDTAAEWPRDVVRQRYEHLGADEKGRDRLGVLLNELIEARLLTEGAGPDAKSSHRIRLAHDTLASLVRERARSLGLPGLRARRLLARYAPDWESAKTAETLGSGDLALVEAGKHAMRSLTDAEARLLVASVTARRRRRIGAGVALTLVLLLVGQVVISQDQARFAARSAVETRRANEKTRSIKENIYNTQDSLFIALALERVARRHSASVFWSHEFVNQGRIPRALLKHKSLVSATLFVKNSRLLTGCQDGTVALWSEDGKQLQQRQIDIGAVNSIESLDDSRVAINGAKGLKVLSIETPAGEPQFRELSHYPVNRPLRSALIQVTGQLALITAAHSIHVVNIKEAVASLAYKLGEATADEPDFSMSYKVTEDSWLAHVFSQDGSRALASIGTHLRVWNTQSRRELWHRNVEDEPVGVRMLHFTQQDDSSDRWDDQVYGALSPDGKYVVSNSPMGTDFWQIQGDKRLVLLRDRQPSRDSNALVFSADSSLFAHIAHQAAIVYHIDAKGVTTGPRFTNSANLGGGQFGRGGEVLLLSKTFLPESVLWPQALSKTIDLFPPDVDLFNGHRIEGYFDDGSNDWATNPDVFHRRPRTIMDQSGNLIATTTRGFVRVWDMKMNSPFLKKDSSSWSEWHEFPSRVRETTTVCLPPIKSELITSLLGTFEEQFEDYRACERAQGEEPWMFPPP